MSMMVSTPMPPTKLNLGNMMGGKHHWTGGGPVNATYAGTKWTVLQSAHCCHLQEPTEAYNQLKMKAMIFTYSDTEDPMKFSQDEKDMTVEELAELVINHMEFHGMDAEFWL